MAEGLLQSLGFTDVQSWSDDKLIGKVVLVPKKVEEADVPPQFQEFYRSLVVRQAGDKIELDAESDPGRRERGAVSSKVDPLLTAGWQTDEEIAKKAGLPLQQVRDRLYFLCVKGVAVRRRLIQTRLK